MATKLYNLDYDLNISVIKPLQQDNFAKIVKNDCKKVNKK